MLVRQAGALLGVLQRGSRRCLPRSRQGCCRPGQTSSTSQGKGARSASMRSGVNDVLMVSMRCSDEQHIDTLAVLWGPGYNGVSLRRAVG